MSQGHQEARDMLDEREVPAVAFVECVKVHHVKLANIDGEPCTVGFPRLWRQLNVMGDGLAANMAGKKKSSHRPSSIRIPR